MIHHPWLFGFVLCIVGAIVGRVAVMYVNWRREAADPLWSIRRQIGEENRAKIADPARYIRHLA